MENFNRENSSNYVITFLIYIYNVVVFAIVDTNCWDLLEKSTKLITSLSVLLSLVLLIKKLIDEFKK